MEHKSRIFLSCCVIFFIFFFSRESYSAVPQGTDVSGAVAALKFNGGERSGRTLQSALSFIGTDSRTLLVEKGTWQINSDVTIPENVNLVLEHGAVVTISKGAAFVIQGPAELPLSRVFSGDGKVKMPSSQIREIYPQWWGAKGDNQDASAAINRFAIQSAVDSAATLAGGGGVVRLLAGKYRIDDEIKVPAGVSLEGAGSRNWASTTLFSNHKRTRNILVLNHDGYFSGYIQIRNLFLSGGNIGIKINEASFCDIENVQVQDCTTGIHVFNSLWNTFTHVDVNKCDVGLHLAGRNDKNTYSNNNTFIGCKFRYCLQTGVLINRGTGNTFVGCNFENSKGNGLRIDNQESGYAPVYRVSPIFGGHSFVNCWFEANDGEAIHLIEDHRTVFDNCNIYNTIAQTYGVVRLEKTRKIRFSGGMIIDFRQPMKHFYIGPASFDTFIDIDSLDMGAVTDLGIGTRYGQLAMQMKTDQERTFVNQTFNIQGSSGSDVFAGWEEKNNIGSNSKITADGNDLLRPRTFSQYSCKIDMGLNPDSSVGIMQSSALLLDTRYYAVIEYRNDSASLRINSPLSVVIYDETNNKFWDHYEARWEAGLRYIEMPLSINPTSVSFPFSSPPQSAVVQLQIINRQYGNDASGVVHHIYSAAIQKNKEPNPSPDNVSPPRSGSWNQGDMIWNTVPVQNGNLGWVCVKGGTPGEWKPFGDIQP